MNKVWTWFATMPSTNVRIATSLLLALATGVRVVGLGWEPPYTWLGFLVIWAGLDVAQFNSKRTTDSSYVAAKVSGEAPPPEPPQKQPEIGA